MLPISLKGQPVDLTDPLFVRLMNCVTDDQHQAFVDRYGALRRDRENVQSVKAYAGEIREVAEFILKRFKDGTVASPGLSAWEATQLLESVSIQPQLALHNGRPRFVLAAKDLASFIAMEVAVAVEAGAQGKRCEHCHRFFLFGPQTANRSHAKYCANKCRVAAMRARNAKRGAEQ